MIKNLILLSFLSYILGSLPFSYLIAKMYGKDLYKIGSKNVGTANVWRATGKIEPTILALGGDLGKGILSLILAQKIFPDQILPKILAAFFSVAGHNWSLFLKFKGGRGLATLAGILLYLNWKAILVSTILLFFSILAFELIMKKKIELEGKLKEKIRSLFKILTSQVLGRVIGILFSAILIFFLWPQTFKIIFPASLLVVMKHIKRTKAFLRGEIV